MSEAIQEPPIQNPFEQEEHRTLMNRFVTAAGWASAAAAGVLAFKYGVDSQFVVSPPVYEQITDGIIAVNQTLREAAPYVAGAGIIAHAGYKIAGKYSQRAQATLDYSEQEYSGLGNNGKKNRFGGRFGRAAAGLGLAASAGVFIVSSTAIEQEVANGPVRAVEAVGDVFVDGSEELVYVVDSEQAHFMNDSRVANSIIEDIQGVAPDGMGIYEFGRGLPNIQYEDGSNTTGFLLSVPEPFMTVSGGSECSTVNVLADNAVDANQGEELKIKEDLNVTVTGGVEGASSMNRSTLVMANEDFINCFQNQETDDPNYFGAVVTGASTEQVQTLLEEAGVDNQAVAISEERFIENNKEFWRANGTPILLQQIAYLGAFAGIALAGARRNTLQQNIREIGTMYASGVQEADMKRIETVRGLRQTAKAMLIAAPLAPVFAGVLNASVRGLEVGTSLRDLAVGYTVLLGSTVLSARRSITKFFKSKTASEMIKG